MDATVSQNSFIQKNALIWTTNILNILLFHVAFYMNEIGN